MNRCAHSARGAFVTGLIFVLAGQFTTNCLAADELAVATDSGNYSWWLIGAVALVLFVGGLIFNADRSRSDQIEAFARSRGIPFRRSPTKSDEGLPIGCSLEQKGTDHVIANVLEVMRTDELVLTMFDYEYTLAIETVLDIIDDRDSTQRYQQTVTRLQSRLLKLPYFNLLPETLFAKLGKVFGGADINFDEAPEFSDQYVLRGGDEPALRTIFTPALRQFLEPLRHLTIEGADDVLFLYRWQRPTKPESFAAAIEESKQLLALFVEGQRSIRPQNGTA